MLLTEIDSGEMIKFNSSLNSEIWVGDELKPEVLTALNKISDRFLEFLKIGSDHVIDIVLTGSMCNFNYTKYSDIDLHFIVNYESICDECGEFDLDDCMKAKKTLWNEQREIKIYGHDIELYVQSEDEKIIGTAGVYSLKTLEWIQRPTKVTAKPDIEMIEFKADRLISEIQYMLDNELADVEEIEALKTKIWGMRKAGLEKDGEYSVENQAFKILRNSGYLEKIRNFSTDKEDESLSLK